MYQSPLPTTNSLISDTPEDSENSPLQIIRDKGGLMKLIRSPYPKRRKIVMKSQGTQSVTEAKPEAVEDDETTTTLTMAHARQFRGMRMKLFQLEEQLSTYKTSSMDVARQSRAARMSLHAATTENASLQEEATKFKDFAENVAEKLQSRLKRMVQAAQKSQQEVKELKAHNEILENLIELERADNEATANDFDSETFYGAAVLMCMLSAMLTVAITQF